MKPWLDDIDEFIDTGSAHVAAGVVHPVQADVKPRSPR